MSADVVRNASNALVMSAEASRTAATAFAQMLAESEAEREKLVAALVKSEAAYAGVLANLESIKKGFVSDSNELALLRELEKTLLLMHAEGRVISSVQSDLLSRLDLLRKAR